jgi:ribonucleoside-diphosphate reductase alpha chain
MKEIKKDHNTKTTTDSVTPHYENLLNARKEAVKSFKPFKNKDEMHKNPDSFKWLTDHSRNFLASGYVPEGSKAEDRIKEIANRAEEILGIKGFSDKFYNYMEKGFFFFIFSGLV